LKFQLELPSKVLALISLKLAGDISLAGHSEGEDESYNIVKEEN